MMILCGGMRGRRGKFRGEYMKNKHLKKIIRSIIPKSCIKILKYLRNIFIYQEHLFIKTTPVIPFHKRNNQDSLPLISIIIPTYNAEDTLEPLLNSLKEQKNISQEIIIIDSGSLDNTITLAKKHHVKIIHTNQKQFNHGGTRTKAAQKAKGKYILFTVQDALFENPYTIYALIQNIASSEKIIGASAMQTPRKDADIYAKWSTDTLYNSLGFKRDKNYILSLSQAKNFQSQTLYIKRKITMFDNVCGLVKKDLFFQMDGFRNIQISEDTDFAIRALKNGYSFAFITNYPVTHSHTRPADYFLKRHYIGIKTQYSLYHEKTKPLSENIINLLNILKVLIKTIEQEENTYFSSINKIIQQLEQTLNISSLQKKKYKEAQEYIHDIYNLVKRDIEKKYLYYGITEREKQTYKEKLIAGICGMCLAEYACSPSHSDMKKKSIQLLDSILMKNV